MRGLFELICDFFATASRETTRWRVTLFIVVFLLAVTWVDVKTAIERIPEAFSLEQLLESKIERYYKLPWKTY